MLKQERKNGCGYIAMVNTQQLATKHDIETVRREVEANKNEILKWMVAGMVAQTALLAAIIAFLKWPQGAGLLACTST